jgi:hypothetical protein
MSRPSPKPKNDERFSPYARLLIFRAPASADGSYVASLMGAEGLDGPISRGWAISTGGCLRSGRIREHIETLLKAVAGKQDLLARLRREGYWVSIWFHDTAQPDAEEFAALSAELEALDITFDFELERV